MNKPQANGGGNITQKKKDILSIMNQDTQKQKSSKNWAVKILNESKQNKNDPSQLNDLDRSQILMK